MFYWLRRVLKREDRHMEITIHVYHHIDGSGGASSVLALLETVNKKVDKLMSASQEVKDAIAKVDVATDKVAAVLTDLRDRVKVGMTQQEVDEVKSLLGDRVAELEAIAKDPDNPVPLSAGTKKR